MSVQFFQQYHAAAALKTGHGGDNNFSNYKEQVIDLLTRVTTVSIETMAIVNAMPSTVEEATNGT